MCKCQSNTHFVINIDFDTDNNEIAEEKAIHNKYTKEIKWFNSLKSKYTPQFSTYPINPYPFRDCHYCQAATR